MSAFKVSVSKLGAGVGQLQLRGNSDEDDKARKQVRKGLSAHFEKGRCRIVVEASELEWASADVLGAIAGDFLRAVEAGGGIAFAGLQGEARELADHLGMTQFVEAHPDVDAAKAALKAAAHEDGELRESRLKLMTTTANGGRVQVLLPCGSLSEGDLDQAQAMFAQLLENQPSKILLDGQRWLDLDAEGAAALVQFATQCQGAGMQLVGSQVWGIPRALLEVMGLTAFLPLYDSPEEALATLS